MQLGMPSVNWDPMLSLILMPFLAGLDGHTDWYINRAAYPNRAAQISEKTVIR
jgi:hypothetical protein